MMPSQRDYRVKQIGILGFIGFLISLYLVKEHYREGPSVCDMSELFSCSEVNRSPFSELLGVPVAIFGAIWCIVLCFGAWKVLIGEKVNYYLTGILLWAILGILFIVYMVIAEIILGAICIFCTIVHILTLAIFHRSYQLFKDLKATPSLDSFIFNMRYLIFTVFLLCITPVFVINAIHQPDPQIVGDLATCLTSKKHQNVWYRWMWSLSTSKIYFW